MKQALPALFAVWLAAWLAMSVVMQVLPRHTPLRQFWFAWLVPEWRFFAPDPSTYDYFLFHRAFGGQIQLVSFSERSRWWFAWNPQARRQKVFRDLADSLQLAAATEWAGPLGIPDKICFSSPYLLLLSFCAEREQGADVVQFGIIRRFPEQPDDVVFVSRWHACR